MRKTALIALALLLVAGIAIFTYLRRTPEITYRTARIQRGTIVSGVSATGNVSAVTTVQVGTQVSGTIHKLYVDYNSQVKKGQPIAEIDPSLFRAAVEQSRGNNLVARANLQKARVALVDAERTMKRNSTLLKEGVISQGDFDTAETAYQSARTAVEAARGAVAQTEGALMQARTNLNYSIIRSPVDGIVISRAVDVGQTVAASFQTPTLFTIAQDLTKMQIEVSVDEADISSIRQNQNVTFSVDSYPERSFRGTVTQIRNAPVITQNVVTYVVLVTVDNSDLKLKPGMTANVTIQVARKDSALRLPLAALRFRPRSAPDADSSPRPRNSAATRPPQQATGEQQVHILRDGKPVAIGIRTGIADDSAIELTGGALKEGDLVVIEQIGGTARKKAGTTGSPMGPRF
jgi:HlyD family secretion protein